MVQLNEGLEIPRMCLKYVKLHHLGEKTFTSTTFNLTREGED